MLNPFQKLFQKSDPKLSADLVEQLERHEQTRPAMEKRYLELDKTCVEISGRYQAAKAAGSPTQVALRSEFEAACRARDGVRGLFNQERSRLHRLIEALTRPVIQAFGAQCNAWTKQAHGQRRVNVLERYYVGDKQQARLADNLTIVREAQMYVNAMRSEVQSMQHRPIQEIQEKIDEVEARVTGFDFDKLEGHEMGAGFVDDFMAESIAPTGQHDTRYMVPDPETTGRWQFVLTDQKS